MTSWGRALPVLVVIGVTLVLMAALQPSPDPGSRLDATLSTPSASPTASSSPAPSPSTTTTAPAPSPTPTGPTATATDIPSPTPSAPDLSPGPTGAGTPPPITPSLDPLCLTPPEPTTISVISYNIKGGRSRHGTGYSLERIARELKRWQPDIVLLQEVDRFKGRSRFHDQPGVLARQLGMEPVFGANVTRGPGGRGRPPQQYGTAILSRFPVVDWANTLLPRSREQRGLLRATVLVDGSPVDVFNTHLQNRDTEARIRQIRVIGRIVGRSTAPVVLGGDFNAHPGSGVVGIARGFVRDTWRSVGRGLGATHPASNPRGRIDYLMHEGLTPVSAEVLDSAASDHHAVRAVYRVPAAETTTCE